MQRWCPRYKSYGTVRPGQLGRFAHTNWLRPAEKSIRLETRMWHSTAQGNLGDSYDLEFGRIRRRPNIFESRE